MAKKSKAEPSVGAPVGIDLAEVERILAFMGKHDLEEFEFEREGIRVRLKKASAPVPLSAWTSAVASTAASAPSPSGSPVASRAASATSSAPKGSAPPAAETAVAEDVHVIKSPIVGTCYLAPSPEAEPFVKLGTHVKVGQALCIVEAMKLMNEIEADVAGEVVKIFAENAHPVEYGEPLFGIRTVGKK
jgi:acetyl-CoA carboxylase biotin carboxyl carrier protein